MKKLIYIPALLLFSFLSCSKVVTYKEELPDRFLNEGAPVITAIYDIRDGNLENPLETGSLNQRIHIVGKNLANPQSIKFNGLEANMDECYCESENSFVLIPRVMPSDVNNTIEYTTSLGTTSMAFEVSIPELSLNGLANEFALPGSTVKLDGDYFDLFGFGMEGSSASVKIGDTPVEIAEVSEAGMSIIIPEGTPDNTLITFSWNDVKRGPQSKNVPYRMTNAMFLGDFSEIGFWDASLAATILTDGTRADDPEYLGYPFLHFNASLPEWTWYSLGMGGSFPLDYDWDNEMDDLVFKFEFWTNPSRPIPAYQSGNGVLVQFNTKANVSLDFGGTALNTGGQWKTMSFPMKDVASEMPKMGDYMNFAVSVQPPVNWTIDFAMGQCRIEYASY